MFDSFNHKYPVPLNVRIVKIEFLDQHSFFQPYNRINLEVKLGGFNDFGFYGPPTPSGQGLCGFNRGWSRVKSLATPCVTEIDR